MALKLFGRLFGLAKTGNARRSGTQKRLRVEALEQRMALATLTVGFDANDDYDTIQEAVNAAQSGDTIKVDPGTYVEQVTVNNVGHSRDNLKIVGVNQNAIIKAPALMVDDKAIVEVNGSQNVTIEKFTIQGPGGGGCDSIRYGIRVDGGGSATITNNHITEIRDDPFSGCQNGVGILVGRIAENESGSAVISKNTIDNYQKGGIVISNTGSGAEIGHNTIVGIGPTPVIAQNGIQISDGATANIHHNLVSDNQYSLQTVASTGILLFEAGSVNISHNNVLRNDVGLYSIIVSGGVVSHNDFNFNTFNGIALDTTIGMLVSHNTTNNNGIGDVVFGDSGIGLYDSTNNTIEHNTSNNNNGDGIHVASGSTGNKLNQNKMKGNTQFDAEDLSPPGSNTWKKNKGNASSPPGLVS